MDRTSAGVGAGGASRQGAVPLGPLPAERESGDDSAIVGVDALPPVTDRILNAGGRILRPAADRNRPNGCEVYASPAGHPFCVCWMPPEPNDSEG